jgi:hypothetical protein
MNMDTIWIQYNTGQVYSNISDYRKGLISAAGCHRLKVGASKNLPTNIRN